MICLFSSYQQGSILRARKIDGSGRVTLHSGLGRTIRDIKIFDKELQPGNCTIYLNYEFIVHVMLLHALLALCIVFTSNFDNFQPPRAYGRLSYLMNVCSVIPVPED